MAGGARFPMAPCSCIVEMYRYRYGYRHRYRYTRVYTDMEFDIDIDIHVDLDMDIDVDMLMDLDTDIGLKRSPCQSRYIPSSHMTPYGLRAQTADPKKQDPGMACKSGISQRSPTR